MSVNSSQIIRQTLRLLPALAREIETSFTPAEEADFNVAIEGRKSTPVPGRPDISEFQQEFIQHVFNVHSKQIDEMDAHCNKIYDQSLDVARDEEFRDIFHRSQIESALQKAGSSPKEFLAIDLAIGASFFTKANKILHEMESSPELTKGSISAFGEIHSEASVLGEEVLNIVSKGTVQKDDLLDLIGNVAEKLYGANGLFDTKQERDKLREIFRQYAVKYKGLLVQATKEMHYE